MWDEITAIFSDMGFTIAEGPDIETDWYNFTALNFPEGHPAREMHDTFFLKPGPDGTRKVLRTHTSPVQIRVMQQTNEKPAAPLSHARRWSRRSASSCRAAPTATTATRPTRRCSTRSRGW